MVDGESVFGGDPVSCGLSGILSGLCSRRLPSPVMFPVSILILLLVVVVGVRAGGE